MGMTKPQPCPHHKDADPAVAPTETIYVSYFPPEVPSAHIPCPFCWQRHSEWLNSALADRDEYIQEIGDEIATAKADTARLAEIKTIIEQRYTSGLTVGQTVNSIRGIIDDAKEGE